jgi:hypothetical protein
MPLTALERQQEGDDVKSIFLSGALFAAASTFLGQASAVTLSLEPSSQDVGLGGTASVDLVISGMGDTGAPSLGAFLTEITFDPAILAFSGVDYGPFLGDPNDSILIVGDSATESVPDTAKVPIEVMATQAASELGALAEGQSNVQTDEPPPLMPRIASEVSASTPMTHRMAKTESKAAGQPQPPVTEDHHAATAPTAQQQSTGTPYVFEIVARNGGSLPGVGTVVSLGKGPSINNQGNVVFTAIDDAGQHAVFTEIDGTLDTRTVNSAIFSFDENVQINDVRNNTQRRITWREQSNDGLVNKINRLGTFGDDFQIVARNRFLPLIESPFDLTRPWATMNNNGRVVFSVVSVFGQATFLCTQKAVEGSGFKTTDDYYCADNGLSNYPDLFPMVSDNDRVVVRGGGDETAPLVVFTKPTLRQSEAIFLGQPNGFECGSSVTTFCHEASNC